MGELAAAAVGRVAAIRRGTAAELAVHRVDAHFDGDLDRLSPVADRGLALVLVRARPSVHRQQRCDLHSVIFQRLLEARDALRIGARMSPPGEEVVARRELDPLVAELGDLARQLLERKMAMHVRVECDAHGAAPSITCGHVARARATVIRTKCRPRRGRAPEPAEPASCQRAPACEAGFTRRAAAGGRRGSPCSFRSRPRARPSPRRRP